MPVNKVGDWMSWSLGGPGIIMASGGEPLFNLFGFGAAMTATGARALKTVLQVTLILQPSTLHSWSIAEQVQGIPLS
jgi:hypothetical protein